MRENFDKFRALVNPLTAFFIGTAFTCCAYALLASILGIRLSKNGVSSSEVGMVLALYYVGYVIAAKTAYRVINRVGHIRAFTAFLSVFSALTLLHFFSEDPVFWGVLRLLEGYCIGGATMCLESWLNSRATNKNRGVVMSLYMVTTYLGASLGQILLNIPDESGVTIYILVSILFSVALVPISLTALPTPDILVHKTMSLKDLYKKTPVGVMGCLTSGIFVGSFYALGTVFSEKSGFSIHETSMFMFFAIFGGMLAQIPIGKLSDKTDRRYIMIFCAGAIVFAAPLFALLGKMGISGIAIGAALIGMFMFVMYPVCVSHINDLVEEDERVQASGKLIMLQGTGLILGPILFGHMMGSFGTWGYLLSFSAIGLLFVTFTWVQLRSKPAIHYLSITPTAPVPVGTTAVFEDLASEDTAADKRRKSRKRKLARDAEKFVDSI